ncbi:MAG: hypothetical protein OSJ43_03725 [Oscillospiraceae bacterium]|nr:hypothetical protein [Oscillospiraceae bacterium]
MINKKLKLLVNYLLSERNDLGNVNVPEDEEDLLRLYRSPVNICPAVRADEKFLKAEDEYLAELTAEKGITDIAELKPVEDGSCS